MANIFYRTLEGSQKLNTENSVKHNPLTSVEIDTNFHEIQLSHTTLNDRHNYLEAYFDAHLIGVKELLDESIRVPPHFIETNEFITSKDDSHKPRRAEFDTFYTESLTSFTDGATLLFTWVDNQIQLILEEDTNKSLNDMFLSDRERINADLDTLISELR